MLLTKKKAKKVFHREDEKRRTDQQNFQDEQVPRHQRRTDRRRAQCIIRRQLGDQIDEEYHLLAGSSPVSEGRDRNTRGVLGHCTFRPTTSGEILNCYCRVIAAADPSRASR